MIKLFRRIRQNLLSEGPLAGRAGRYLTYAIGEIILVVIGILIALQVNNWNNELQSRKQEKEYLTDIRANLISDKAEAEGCINFNNYKITVVDSVLRLLNEAEESSDYMSYVINHQRTLSSFPTFDPVSTAFDNMTASYSINMIQNTELRMLLSNYYSFDWEKSPQSVSRSRTRKFADILVTKMISEPLFHKDFEEVYRPMLSKSQQFDWVDDFSMDFQDPNYFEFHEDREAISSMVVMVPTSIYQNRYIEEKAIARVDSLVKMIDKEMAKK